MGRTTLFLAAFFAWSTVAAGEDILGATLDGRKIILHSDGTWEYKTKITQGVAPAGVALLDFERQFVPADVASGQMNRRLRLKLRVKNLGAKPVKAWKGSLVVKNHFDEVLCKVKVTRDEAHLEPNGIGYADFTFEDNQYVDDDHFDLVFPYEADELKLVLNEVRLAQ